MTEKAKEAREESELMEDVAGETAFFEIRRADNCIWLKDLRVIPVEIHMTPEQAVEVGCALIAIGDRMQTGEHKRFIGDVKT